MVIPDSVVRALSDEELETVARWVNAEVRKRQKQFDRDRRRDAVKQIEALIRSVNMSWDELHRLVSCKR